MVNSRDRADILALLYVMFYCVFITFPFGVLCQVYNPFLVYCRELAPGTVSLTGDRAQGDDSKHDSNYSA